VKPKGKLLQSLLDFAADFGVDVLSLPLHIFDEHTAPYPAYTTDDGLFVSNAVVEKEPENVKVYLAHEIWHHIIHEPEVTHMFSHAVVNAAEDYKINQFLLQTVGYDVRKVKIKGIFSKKYDKMSVAEVAQAICSDKDTPCCGSTGIAHPLILSTAYKLRLKYADLLQRKTEDLFFIDRVDRETFYKSLSSLSKKWKLHSLPYLNVEKTMLGVWSHLFLEAATANKVGNTLLPDEAISYCFSGLSLRNKTVGKPEVALLTAALYLESIDNDELYLHMLTIRTRSAINRLKLKFSKKLSRVERSSLRKRLIRLQRKEAFLQTLPPLWKALKEEPPIDVFKSRDSLSPRVESLRTAHKKDISVGSVRLPNFDKSRLLAKRLNSCMKRASQRVEDAAELFDQLKAALPELTSGASPEQNTDKKQQTNNKLVEISSEEQNTDKKQQNKKSVDQKLKEGPTKIKEDNAQDSSVGAESASNDSDKPGLVPQTSDLSTGEGSSVGTSNKVKILESILNGEQFLRNVLFHVQEIETHLKSNPSKLLDPNGNVPTNMTYGDDLENLIQSEVALLALKETELEFFSRYANNALLINSPSKSKRSPVIFCLDCSGSMAGAFYETAAGFCLAMMRKLYNDGRGAALLTFSVGIEKTVILKPGQTLPMSHLLDVLGRPSFGGTDFDIPLNKAFDIKEEEDWKEVEILLISDGYGVIQKPEAFQFRKTGRDRIVAIMTSNVSHLPHVDEIHHVKRNSSSLSLIKVGNNLL
jgi:uncharacterized protein with von Willebrand factor type A (vWA) domain